MLYGQYLGIVHQAAFTIHSLSMRMALVLNSPVTLDLLFMPAHALWAVSGYCTSSCIYHSFTVSVYYEDGTSTEKLLELNCTGVHELEDKNVTARLQSMEGK